MPAWPPRLRPRALRRPRGAEAFAAALTLGLVGVGGCDAAPGASARSPAPTATAAAAAAQFADAAGPASLDRTVRLAAGGGTQATIITSWRFEPATGLTEARNVAWCGVQLDAQTLTTIGRGATEAVSCEGLADAGALPDGRIGLIYHTASPNARSLTAVVLVRGGQAWRVDEAATERLQDLAPANLSAVRQALR